MNAIYRRVLPLLLCLILLFSFCPAGAFAQEELTAAEQAEAAPVEEPAEESAEPIEEPAEEPMEEPTEESAEEPSEEPAEEPSEEPVEEPAEEPVEEPSEEPVEEPAEEPAGEPSEEPAEEPAEVETEASEAELNGWVKSGSNWTYYRNNVKVINDWVKDGGQWYYMGTYGYMVSGCCRKIGGNWYLFKASGVWVSTSGWVSQEVDGESNWYYLQNGSVLTGWQKIGGSWYYLDPEMLTDGNVVDGKRYLFSASGVWVSGDGWKRLYWGNNDYWYYLKNSEYVTGWQTIGGKQYYFKDWGEMAVGSVEIGGVYYVFDNNGQKQNKTGWLAIPWVDENGKAGNDWYYVLSSGKPAVGLRTIDGKRYYFYEDGRMATGSQYIGGKLYFFDLNSGAMVVNGWASEVNTYEDGSTRTCWYYLGSTGAGYTGWVDSGSDRYFIEDGCTIMGLKQYKGITYVFNVSGSLSKGGWVKSHVDGDFSGPVCWYYANSDGSGYTGWLQYGGDWYYFFNGKGAVGSYVVYKSGVGTRYLFNADGTLSKGGWVSSKGRWYYANSDGTPKTGWQQIGGKWYYFNEQSHYEMVANTTMKIDGVSYTFDANGVCTNR